MSSTSSNFASAVSIIDTSLLLCQCIEEWQRLEPCGERDGKLNWEEIARLMSLRTGNVVLKSDLQTVWKFIAYGKHLSKPVPEESETYSDNEDPYYQPFTAVKRNRMYLTQQSQLTQEARDQIPLSSKKYLPNSVPNVLSVQALCKDIKVRALTYFQFHGFLT
jgi:hypothetical protein